MSATRKELEADLFDELALDLDQRYDTTQDETRKLAEMLRARFGETVATLEQIAKHPCAWVERTWADMPPGTCECNVCLARAELARLKSGGAQHG